MEIRNVMNSSIETLYKIYDALNEKYYNSSLPEVIMTIQDSKGKYYGWFSWNRWDAIKTDSADSEENSEENAENSKVHEINITPEFLARPFEQICATVNHEMVHLYCHLNDIKDTSNKGKYHNKKFKSEAEKRGLSISKENGIGWSVTTPTEDFIEFINSLNLPDSFYLFRVMPPKVSASSSGSQKKYVCPNCGMKLRGKSGLHIMCQDCEVSLIEE